VNRTVSDTSTLENPRTHVAVDDDPVSSDEVRDLVHRALLAMVVGAVEESHLFTHDVTGYSPYISVRSRIDLEDQLSDRTGGLSNVDLLVDRVDEVSGGWVATWRVCGDHTGSLLLNEDLYFAPTGRRIDVSATTHLVLQGRRLRTFQTSYDDQDVAAQLRGG
jgi:hypothetical protein